ncbi:magnesium/cobalt transporter CorA [Paenibacillus sp. P26]|nr:magnesium/cobalt transporter CorA [Paenibacillus sp. P26]
MIRILAVTKEYEIVEHLSLHELGRDDIGWYWVDFNSPTEEEAMQLETHFHFHPLAIEDCFHLLQRPKLDYYEDVQFFVLHAINEMTLAAEEVDLFVGANFVVSFHFTPLLPLEEAWQKMKELRPGTKVNHLYGAYLIIDKLVDHYFPCVYQIEDELNNMESNTEQVSVEVLMGKTFEIRSKLLKLRRTIFPMRDLLYRVINSERIEGLREQMFYFTDIYDHLLKLSEILESNREVTADLRDSYISLNSNRMNNIMKTLTVITTIFMPLTFIAGIYGMNFHYMPELSWHWGYFAVWGVMLGIGLGMFFWFKAKGWFK